MQDIHLKGILALQGLSDSICTQTQKIVLVEMVRIEIPNFALNVAGYRNKIK